MSVLLGFLAVTIRTTMNWPGRLDTGSIVLTGLELTVILASVEAVIPRFRAGKCAFISNGQKISNVPLRVLNQKIGRAHLSNAWGGAIDNNVD